VIPYHADATPDMMSGHIPRGNELAFLCLPMEVLS